MDDDPISSSSEEDSPTVPAPTPTPSTTTTSAKIRLPPPRKKFTTRQQVSRFGSLSTGRSKKELLATPRFDTSMKTAEQARKLLIERDLLLPNQDPDPSSLSTVLLHLEQSIPGVTAPGAEAIQAVALLLDSLIPSNNSAPTLVTPPATCSDEMHKSQPSLPPTTDLADQIAEIKTTIKELREAAATNETSANMLSRTVDEIRDELHNAAQVVSISADKLTDNCNRPNSPATPNPATPPPETDQQSIVTVLQEIKALIRERPLTPPSSYKDALLKSNLNQRTTNSPSPQEQARANAALKERQMLIDLAEDHPTKRQFNSHDEMMTLFQTALDAIKDEGSPEVKLKSLIILKNGGILLELSNKEAVDWVKNDERRKRFAEATGGNLTIKDRFFVIVVPAWTALENEETLRNIEEDNKIPQNSIASARWIKPVHKRSPFQMYAHAMISLTSPTVANQLLKNGIYISSKLLRPTKDKKEPLRCLKCQKWGHLARVCKAEVDICGICADNHRTSACPSEKPQICVNCNTSDHSSSSRKCPEFLRRCSELNDKTPENSMPYFPTGEDWTQAALPPKATGNLVPTRPPHPQTTSSSKERQATLDDYANRRKQPPTATSSQPTAVLPSPTPVASPSSTPLPPSPLPPPLSLPPPKDDLLLSTDGTSSSPTPPSL